MDLVISARIESKLSEKHPPVTVLEVEEAFFLFDGKMILDTREQHKTYPPSLWFLSETMDGRLLKLVIMIFKEEQKAVLKTAYEPDQEEIEQYESRV